MDTLLLHTAISLDKSGDKEQAKLFYQTVIDDYPDKKSSKIAKNNLDKL
jgi:TolA-binding protein